MASGDTFSEKFPFISVIPPVDVPFTAIEMPVKGSFVVLFAFFHHINSLSFKNK
jgi:hypothetical protein